MLRHSLAGSGTPPVVLLNGAGVRQAYWRLVVPGLAQLTQVLAYDRSLPPGFRRHPQPIGAHTIAELRALLDALELAPPYLLVAHSLGGLHADLFARHHPGEVAGMVLVDCSHPEQERRFAPGSNAATRGVRALVAFYDRLFGPGSMTEVVRFNDIADEIAAAPAFPDIPLTVITAGRIPPRWMIPAHLWAIHLDNQRELAALSPRGRQVMAAASDHHVPVKQPDIIIEAVAEMLHGLRGA